MTKREYLEEWFYKHGYWKTDVDVMSDEEITDKFCDTREDCMGCPFIDDCPPLDEDEICEWIHLRFMGDINEE